MQPPLISVIISACDGPACLAESVESVLAQTHKNTEIIIVDDGSDEATAETIRPYWPLVRYYYDVGYDAGSALNAGAREANGEWIGIMARGSHWMPDKLHWQLKAMSRFGQHCGVCLTGTRQANAETSVQSLWRSSGHAEKGGCGQIRQPLPLVLEERFQRLIPSVLVKRTMLERIGGVDPSLIMDPWLDALFRLGQGTGFCYVDMPLVVLSGTGAPNHSRAMQLAAWQQMYEKWRGLVAGERGAVKSLVARRLAAIYDRWADYYLAEGQQWEARRALAKAFGLHASPRLAVKRALLSVAPDLGKRLWPRQGNLVRFMR